MQILRDIYKLTGEEYRMVPNIFAIRWERGLVLVDCGTGESDWITARETLRYWGLEKLDVTHVLITHAHRDHAGYAAKLQRDGAMIIAGAGADCVEHTADPRNFYYAFHEPFPAFVPDRYVTDGDIIEIGDLKFEVIEASGHSCCDIVYKVEMYGKQILFLGDVFHIGEYGAGAWIGEEWFIDSDYDKYMRSLYRLKDIPADVLLSGHKQGCLQGAEQILHDAFIKAQERFDGRWDKKKFLEEILNK